MEGIYSVEGFKMEESDELWRDSDDENVWDGEKKMFSNYVDKHQGNLDNSNVVTLVAMFDEHGQQLECPNLPLGPAPSTKPAQANPPLAGSTPSPRNVRPEVVVTVSRLDEDGNEYFFGDEHELFHEEVVVASSSVGAVRAVGAVEAAGAVKAAGAVGAVEAAGAVGAAGAAGAAEAAGAVGVAGAAEAVGAPGAAEVVGAAATAGRRRAQGGRSSVSPVPSNSSVSSVPSVSSVSSSWKRGDRLVQVCVTDDDVPEDLRDRILRLVADREARESRAERRRMEVDNDDEADHIGQAALFEGDASSLHFDWHPMDSFQGERETFLQERTGPTTPSGSVYEAFRQYWDDSIMSHIATETNRYAVELARNSDSFARDWYETNVHEIFILFSFWMMLGIIRMPSIKSCFTENFLLKTHIFRKLFSRQRYANLCRALHFIDNTTRTPDSHLIFPIEPVINHLNSRFQSAYIPKQEICIDESLTLWKGKLSFKQYIKTKKARYGIKTLELCESSTGYMWSFFVYTGKENTPDPRFPSSLNVSSKSLLKLIWPLLDKGYTLFMDNWFNSPLLARFLKKRRTDCVGTLRANRQNVPFLVSLCKLQAGQFLARHSGDVVTMAYQDKKKVPLISTYHGTEQGLAPSKPRLPPQWKPQLVLDYNKNMGGIDRKDQMLAPYSLERGRGKKWNIKLFKRLLNVSILNSRILFEQSCNERKHDMSIRLNLVEDIIDKHLTQMPRHRSEVNPCSSRIDLPSRRLTNNVHWPTKFMLAPGGRTLRHRCIWCSKRHHVRRITTYQCDHCKVALCIEPCFKLYHTIN